MAGTLDIRLFAPDPATIEEVRRAVAREPLSYEDVGATRWTMPEGWPTEDASILLGKGLDVFERGAVAVREWRMFDLSWIRMPRRKIPVEGDTVAFASRQLGGWTINSCRVVYVLDERTGPAWRSGFAYGTLAVHAVAGEEQFLVTWDRDTDEVRFGIRKFSRLLHPLVRLAGPVARSLQRRFTRDALAAVLDAVRAAG
jgi:uncharacterized protein (UPF0548 family)